MSEPTIEEVKKRLEDMGIKPGQWGEVSGRSISAAAVLGTQGQALLKMRSVLETLMAKDQADLSRLKEQLARLQHGGGS